MAELARGLAARLVKIEVALAFGCASIIRKASSRSLAGHTDATGPKISSRPIVMAGVTSSNTVGPMKKPSGRSARESAAVSARLRALADAALDVAHPLVMRPADDRPHADARLEPVADLQRCGGRDQPVARRAWASPTGTSTLPARHRSPAQP